MGKTNLIRIAGIMAAFSVIANFHACGKKESVYDTNLLKNPSFEEVKNGMPVGWKISVFRGLRDEKPAQYGIDNFVAASGERSFFFKGEDDTRQWFILSQEVPVKNATHVRLRGSIKADSVYRNEYQFSQCNFFLIYYDVNHNRFQEMRFADKRTRVQVGTFDWSAVDQVFRLPKNISYVEVACVLGMEGTAWFDDISIEVPTPIPWSVRSTKNFDFYALPGGKLPDDAIANQQRIFDHYCELLGVESDIKIAYYFYPDTASIRNILSLRGAYYVSWQDREIHTVQPNMEQEIIHFITDEYGMPPRSIAMGSAFYLMGSWRGKPVHFLAKQLLAEGKLPPLEHLLNYGTYVDIDNDIAIPAAASFVGFLIELWGPRQMLELFAQVNGANSHPTFAAGFEKAYGVPLEQVEERWRQFLEVTHFTTPDPAGSGESQ